MRAQGYSISGCYVSGISFHHKSKNRNDKFILRYEGAKDVYNNNEWVASGQENKYFKFQVQDYETYNRDWDFDAYFTPMNYYIGITDMKKFVNDVIEAVDEYYE